MKINKTYIWRLGISLVLFIPGLMYSQQALAQQIGDEFSHSTPSTPPDQFSGGCNNANNPYAGMDPLVCKGISQPVDSRGQCSLPRARLLRRIGTQCFYCQSIPRINALIVPISQIRTTYRYYRCGVDQADKCSAICSGGPPASAANPNSILPPACQRTNPPAWCPSQSQIAQAQSPMRNTNSCVPPDNLSPADRARWYQQNVLSGRIRCSGAYNPCNNPTKPAWCQTPNPLPWEQPADAAPLQGGTQQDPIPCLYSSEAYRSGQLIRLNADVLAQDKSNADYNCFSYATAFIAGAFPPGSDFTSLSPEGLYQRGFSRMGLSTTLKGFPPAKTGDLVTVENATPGRSGASWSHVGIVIGVDLNGRITRIRQKIGPNAADCVKDTTAAQFQAIERLNPGEQYELWRSDSVDFLGKLAQ
jgi:hypothetical protein